MMNRYLALGKVICWIVLFSGWAGGSEVANQAPDRLLPAAYLLTKDLLGTVKQIETIFSDPAKLTPENCSSELKMLNRGGPVPKGDRGLFSLASNHFVQNIKTISSNAQESFLRLRNARAQLRQRMIQFHRSAQLDVGCVNQMRVTFRALRYIEEFLSFHFLKDQWKPKQLSDKEYKMTESHHPALSTFMPQEQEGLAKGGFRLDQLKTGDVFTNRGTSAISSAITRVGVEDAQFSHTGMIYRDPEGKLFIIESLIEDGLNVKPFDFEKLSKLARFTLYRYNGSDPTLPQRAAEWVVNFNKKRDEAGNPVLYDFKQTPDQDLWACWEVPFHGYAEASNGEVLIPQFQTSFQVKNQKFLDRVGMAKTDFAYAPGDIEVDPHFDMVFEWRNFELANRAMLKDLVWTKIFDWMDRLDYEYKNEWDDGLAAGIAVGWRQIPLLNTPLKAAMGPDITVDLLRLIIQLEGSTNKMLAFLEQKNKENRHNLAGLSMLPSEIWRALDSLRSQDLTAYREGRSVLFSDYFRPANPSSLNFSPGGLE